MTPKVILLAAACATLGAAEAPPSGLVVDAEGRLLKDGAPYRAIGVNYFSAFLRSLQDPDDTSYREGFDELAKRGIPFIRFNAGGFWPKEWRLYREEPEAYFRRMDAFVAAAEEKGIGLIPSLCWWYACVPDLVGESCNQWGNPDSKTIAFLRQYVKDVVVRYVDSPAVWAWELGNEYSLTADLPNAADHRPWVKPDLGTATSRSEADELTHDDVVTASREFAQAVRQYDPRRPITTGHSLPRPSAHHQRFDGTWGRDTKQQFQGNLLDVTPDPLNLISVHVYPFDEGTRFGQKTTTYEEILGLCLDASARAGKALFVGEFGASDKQEDGGPARAREENLEILAAIESTGVPLAALWVFDLPHQDSFINVTPTNHRSYLLDELERANKRLRSAGK